MTDWTPIRKVAAAAITAVLASGGVLAYLEGTGDLSWKKAVGAVVAAVAPVIVAYLVPNRPTDDMIPGGEPGDM